MRRGVFAQVSALIAAFGAILILSVPVSAKQPEPAVVGYLAAFKGLETSIARIDRAAFTHFNIAFANPDATGRFVVGDALACMADEQGTTMTVARLEPIVRDLQAGGAKVLVSLGGGLIPACSGDWQALLAPARRAVTIAGLVELVERLGLDGIDVDLEGVLLTDIDRAGKYVPFVADLSAQMRARGKLLTCATASYEGGMVPIGSIAYFDLVNVMSYDAIGPTWGPPGAEHSTFAGTERDLDLWLQRGVARERLVLGVPFYGYGFGGEQPNWSYRDLAARLGDAATRGTLIGEACAGCRYITFNGPDAIERKARLAAEIAGGVMVWELSQDSPDHALTRAIDRGLGRDETGDD